MAKEEATPLAVIDTLLKSKGAKKARPPFTSPISFLVSSFITNLDVTFGEDACQIYRENAAENVACLRHMALNMLRAETTKISMPMKQKRCMMTTGFLEGVLFAGFASMVN